MRVTNKMLSNNFLSDMRANLENMKTLQEQMTSGKEIRRPSDDPFKVARAMQLHTDINANKQYNNNIKDTINWLDTTDTALDQAGNVLQRISEQLVSAGNAAYGSNERRAIKDELNQKIGQFAQILNTNFDGKYVFGGSRGTTKPLTTSINNDGNTELAYYDKQGNVLPSDITKICINNLSNWDNKKLTISIDGSETVLDIPDKNKSVDALVSNIQQAISSNNIQDKISVEKVTEGTVDFVRFISAPGSTVKLLKNQQNASGSAPDDITSYLAGEDKTVYTNQTDMVKAKLSTEISQGVSMEYNITAGEILEFSGKDSSGNNVQYDLRNIFKNIVTHLDNQADVSKLANEDLNNITGAINNLLKLRAEVGSKQNRMDSAKEQNEDENFNMTEILSKTEDIDITEKTMEYSTMQTVYLASLQTSAKVLQPSLIDYLR